MFYGMFIPDFGKGVSKTLQMSFENTHLKHFARIFCVFWGWAGGIIAALRVRRSWPIGS